MEALTILYKLTKIEYDILGRAVAAYMAQIRTARPLTEEEKTLEGIFSDDIDNLRYQDVRIALKERQFSQLVAIVAKMLNTVGYRTLSDYVLRNKDISETILQLLYQN